MAGEDNIKGKGFDNRSTDEVRAIQRKGGINSGKARREKKKLKEQMELLLSMPVVGDDLKEKLTMLGIDDVDQDNQMALVVAMVGEGLKGDVAAFNSIRDLIGEKPVDKLQAEVTNINDKDVEEMEKYMAEQWEKEKTTET